MSLEISDADKQIILDGLTTALKQTISLYNEVTAGDPECDYTDQGRTIKAASYLEILGKRIKDLKRDIRGVTGPTMFWGGTEWSEVPEGL